MAGFRQAAQRGTALVVLGLLAACSSGPGPEVAQPAPLPARPAPPVVVPPAPQPAAANVVWALRGGLNVAALLCRDRAIAADYNRMLKVHRSMLNDAYAAEQARFRQTYGSNGPARHDAAMTRLYNGFASVPDRRRFCLMASRIAAEIVSLPSAEVPRIAARALTTLEPGAMRLVNSAN